MLGGAGMLGSAGGVKTAWVVGGLPNCFQPLLAGWFCLPQGGHGGKRLRPRPRGGRLPSKWGGRPPSSRARGAEMVIAEGGGVSPGIEERGSEGIPVVTRRVAEKMVVMPGTWSSDRREPLS